MQLTREDLIKLISLNRDVVVDEPFNNFTHSKMIFYAIHRKDNKKIFALIYHKDEKLYVDLKSNPAVASELIEAEPYILPGKHFDKIHWLTVDVEEIESEKELLSLVETSFKLTK
ncbi:MmcQ/YjbR family DNA-binding protein [Companilactobacillus ginsenosidimutans]|uniref:MmcQ/YjbR family DNA-binding protein n=1 Tax=Companilactobacillus ginsenosidimutans TaxID=1007676 RepID=UPI00066070D6|nr:MmcQ/YjbR family DNA-binding protein [Companilactobacillus ginsenosidimutans]